MKKQTSYLFLITIVLLFSTKLVYAEGQTSTALPTATSAVEVTATPTSTIEVTPTPTPVGSQEPTPTVTPLEIPGITDNSLYKDLLLKKDTLNNLIAEENKVCASIKIQESSNNAVISLLTIKSKSYNEPYIKIIDEIKLLLNPIKEKKSQNLIELNKNNNNSNPGNTLNKEIEISTSQIANLNLAIKAMRESIKYISPESIEYNSKVKTAQQQIDMINDNIAVLYKKIAEDKLNKDNEWENFCTAMYKKDLKTANTSYENIIKTKERIINNYKEILNQKTSIGKLLLPLQ